MMTEKEIREALETEFPDAEPSAAIWERVKRAVPARTSHGQLSRLTASVVLGLVVLTGGVAVANTPQLQALAEKYFQKSGIILVQAPALPSVHIPTISEKVDHSKLRQSVPADMKLPSYLPIPLDGPTTETSLHHSELTFGVLWYTTGEGDAPYLALSRYARQFDGEGTFGPVQEVSDVKIGQAKTAAYRDRLGWHILWKVDGSMYHLQATNLPLSEAVRVAESLQ